MYGMSCLMKMAFYIRENPSSSQICGTLIEQYGTPLSTAACSGSNISNGVSGVFPIYFSFYPCHRRTWGDDRSHSGDGQKYSAGQQ